jgi:ketosteroid isomerase-like protein
MSQASVSVVEDAYRALTGGGLEAFADYWADDIEWQAMRGRWRGRKAGIAYMQEWLDLFDDFTTEPIELIDAGDQQVVLYLRYRGRARGSGVEVPPEYFAIVIDIRDDKIARAREFATRGDALSDVGLRE